MKKKFGRSFGTRRKAKVPRLATLVTKVSTSKLSQLKQIDPKWETLGTVPFWRHLLILALRSTDQHQEAFELALRQGKRI